MTKLSFVLWRVIIGSAISLDYLAMTKASTIGMVLHEFRDSIPAGFVNNGPATSNTSVTLRISLVQNNILGLEKALYDVSTPGNEPYGQHLSKADVEGYVKPSSETVMKVNNWLSKYNVTAKTTSPAGDWLSISLPISKANELLQANFSMFSLEEKDSDASYVRTMSYSIPTALKGHINFIHPTVMFPSSLRRTPVISSPLRRRTSTNSAAVPSACAPTIIDPVTITPECLQTIYNIPATLATQSSNQLGVSGFFDEYVSEADLQTFLTTYRPDLPSTTSFEVQTFDGGSNSGAAGFEANLDIQYTVGVASGVPTIFISAGDSSQNDDLDGFLDLMNFLLSQEAPPQVITTSYGSVEFAFSQPMAVTLCNACMQLGARGTSIFFASGDGGVGGAQENDVDCTNTAFVPTYPAGCPYLTSVGATTNIPEVAASLSSGGFSNFFSRPAYQDSAVSSYLSLLGDTYLGLYNTSGRGFPDVAAQGNDVAIIYQGQPIAMDGTSCSSPIFASVVSLLNDELSTNGKSPLGFLNPLLYSVAGQAALNDITSGNNPGCGTNGFSATTGWDPITGLGTPNYAKLKAAVGL